MRPDHALDPLAEIDALLRENAELRAALRKVHRRLELIFTAWDRGFDGAYVTGCARAGSDEIRAALAASEGRDDAAAELREAIVAMCDLMDLLGYGLVHVPEDIEGALSLLEDMETIAHDALKLPDLGDVVPPQKEGK